MRRINVGIIGAGRIGQLHANNILKSKLFELRAITDITIEHLQNTDIQKQVPIITTNVDDIFNDSEIEAIFICSSTDTHADFIKRAARARKHIFCEKPISFSLEQTRKALKVVEESGVKFQSGFNRRFDKNFKKVFDTVRSNDIGEPHIIKVTSRDPEIPPAEYVEKSGGMFMDMTIHDFDMVRFLAGSEVVEISVSAANLVDPMFEKYDDVDTAIITMRFENGALGVIDNSRRAAYGYDQRIEVFGDKGVVQAGNEHLTSVKVATHDGVVSDNPKYFFLDRYQDAYVEEINSFAAALLHGEALLCTGDDGYKAELLAYAARISWKESRTIKMSELEPVNI